MNAPSHAMTTLALVAGILFLTACSGGGDSLSSGPSTFVLQYDGRQDSSPNLAGNTTYRAAARFTASQTAALAGGKLTQLQFYIQTVPDSCKVLVYGAGTASSPGALLYSATVIPTGASWNNHDLTSDVTVPSGDFWLAVEFTDTNTQPTIGCDPGPAVADGRWLYNSGTGNWAPFAASVNWNIRGVVEVSG